MGGEEIKRDQWGSKLDFILSCLGYAVGLGNVWRFPYLCGRSGGAAFLVPYFIMMIFAGFPTFYMELAIGQYAALTPHMLYKRMCPVFQGIGYAMMMISAFTGIYYNMIIAWSMYYFGVSFRSRLLWEDCRKDWNNEYCWDDKVARTCNNLTQTYWTGQCLNNTELLTLTGRDADNITDFWEVASLKNASIRKETPASQYLNRRVLNTHLADGISDIGTPQWELVLCLFFAWVMIFFCLIKGVKSSGKVVYFTATFPYVILLILLIRGVTLDGAIDGIQFYLEPNWTKVGEAGVWGDAAVQIFFSLSLGGGGLTTLASYNDFNNNLLRDSLIVVLGNCGTSLFAGFVIFPIIGFVAKKTGRTVADVAAKGTTLAFVAYPDALVEIKGAPFWCILFFFMLIILGIDSQLVIVEVVITCIIDQWPSLRHWKKKIGVVGGVCCVSFLIGLVLTCPGGSFVLDLLDTFAGGWPLVMACLAEVCMVSYCYGFKRFIKDIRLMMGVPPNMFWKLLGYPVNPYWWVNWVFITPPLLTFVLLFNWAQWKGMESGDYKFPWWGEAIGWGISMFCVIWIPLFAIINIIRAVVQKKGMRWLITPTRDWGPNNEEAKLAMAGETQMRPQGVVSTQGYAFDNKGFAVGTYPAVVYPSGPS